MSTSTPVPPSAIVFGASGSVGRALTEQLLAEGRFGEVIAAVRGEAAVPQGARRAGFDLDDEASILAAFEQATGPLALVVVATGMLHDQDSGIFPEKTVRSLDAAAMAKAFAINAIGPAMIAKHAASHLVRHERSVFAALSARVGSIGDNRLGGWHSYRASKAALNMLLRNLAIELVRSHPRAIVAALHPGTVDSRLSAPFRRSVAPGKLFTPDRAASQLLSVIESLTPADSGGLFSWDGQLLPW